MGIRTTVFSPASLEGAFVHDVGNTIGAVNGTNHSEFVVSGSGDGTGTANFTFTTAAPLINLLAGLAYTLIDPGFSIIPVGSTITDIQVAIGAQADTYGVGTAYTWTAYWDNILEWSGAVPNGGPFSLGGTVSGLTLNRNGQSKLFGSSGGSTTFPFGFRILGASTVPSIDGFQIQTVTVTLTWTEPVPSPPTVNTPTVECSAIHLSWTASSGINPTFEIYRSIVSGSGYALIASLISGTTYTDSTVVNDILYYYVLREVTGGGTSTDSNEVSGTAPNIWWTLPNGTKKASCSQPACTMYPYDIVWEGVTYAAGTCMPWTLTTEPDSSYCAADDGSWYHGACPIVPKQWRLQQFSLKQRPEATS